MDETKQELAKNIAFVVIAYRYGMRDDHSYLVAVCDTLGEAKEAAKSEMEYRGGKYGCEVSECPRGPWHEDLDPRQVHYVPSPSEGILGEGYHPADMTTEGWKERMAESLRSKINRLTTTPEDTLKSAKTPSA